MTELAEQLDVEIQSLEHSHIHILLEDRTRLYKRLDDQLGISRFTWREQIVVLKNISLGLQHLSNQKINAKDWSGAFEQLASSASNGAMEALSSVGNVAPHPIMQVLIDQPATNRTTEQRQRSQALGAMAVMSIAFQLRRTPRQFSDHLKQLFRSSKEGWRELCCVDFLNAEALQAWKPKTPVAVITDFQIDVISLLQVGIPTVTGFLTSPAPIGNVTTPEIDGLDPVRSVGDQPGKARTKKIPDDLTPRFDLFEVQKQRDCQLDIVDGYRLPFHWSRLDPAELQQALAKLNNPLRSNATDTSTVKARAHAAARYASLFCGMSLKKCLRLPLRRRGSMTLDIAQGVIRRDLLLVAPRMDIADRKRVHGRWWRTRLPVEVHLVLQQLWALHPQARTLGEILKCVGLDHEACQHLLNDMWPTSHSPEDSRFAMSLRPCLLALGIHPTLVARVSGDTMTTPASDHYYLSFLESQVHDATASFCRWAGLTPPSPPVRDRRIGTPKGMSIQEFSTTMAKLNQRVFLARNEITTRSTLSQIIRFHNLYTRAVALQIIWGVGGRGDRVPSMTLERLFASPDYLAVSDRRVDRYSRQRICPSTRVLTATRCHYLEHLRSLAESLQSACTTSSQYVLKLAVGHSPHRSAFFILEETADGWIPRTMTRQDLVALASDLEIAELNVARHFWFSELVARNVAQVAIEALLGHHIEGAEAFGFSSGISVREVCDYLRPILEQAHDELGIEPLVGRGRQASRFLKFPEKNVARTLRPLPSVLLKHKLDAQDLTIREVLSFEQDPPATTKTLTAHTHIDRLKKQYLNCNVARKHPAGALLFCLITFDLVLTPCEQGALLMAAVKDNLFAVGRMAIAEASDASRPVSQRLLQDHTIAAAHLARTAHKGHEIDLPYACKALHRLLKALDSSWPSKDDKDSSRLLAMMASHWAAIEVPQGSLFSVFHKAPFVPAHDLARLHFQRARFPAAFETSNLPTQRWKNDGDFDPVLKIVNHWADKDLPLGESEARRAGCRHALSLHRKQADLDEVDFLLLDLLRGDLSSQPPYRTLSPTVLPEYVRGYATYFSYMRREGTVQLDPDTLLEAFAAMGGGGDFTASGPARWQMLHICAFLQSKGHWAPAGFLTSQARKVPVLPRLPVYTSLAEISASRQLMEQLFEGRGGTFSFSGLRLALQRAAPMRVSEPRYSRPVDWDKAARLLHITSTKHDHLKSEFSRGSVPVPQVLATELTQLCERRQALSIGPDTLLFCDAHLAAPYASFDAISDAMRHTVIAVTGCPHFRQHDLRAAAATDAAFNLEAEVGRAGRGEELMSEPLTSLMVTLKHGRFAWSARLARHASPLTTLRYYICSGLLDLHHHLELAHGGLDFSARYVACLLGKNAQALYAAAHRAGKTGRQAPGRRTADHHLQFNGFIQRVLEALPVPRLGQSQEKIAPVGTAVAPRAAGSRLNEAVIFFALGMSEQAAGDATQLPVNIVAHACRRFQRRCGELKLRTGNKDELTLLSSGFESAPLSIPSIIRRFAIWLSSNKTTLQQAALPLISAVDRSGTRLTVQSEAHLLEILPVLKSLHGTGLRTVFRIGPDLMLPNFPAAEFGLRDACIEVHKGSSKEPVFCILAFLLKDEASGEKETKARRRAPMVRKEASPESASPRSHGRAGRIVVAGLVAGLSL